MSDPVIRALRALPTVDPDAARTSLVRARCRARLARRSPPAPVPPIIPLRRPLLRVGPAVIAVLAVVYLIDVVRFALRMFGAM